MKSDFLNPRFLRYFIKVADLGSLVSASKDLNVSQPSITRAVQILENNLGYVKGLIALITGFFLFLYFRKSL